MIGLRNIAEGAAHYLGEELQLSANDRAAVRFGLENFLGTVINLAVIIGIAWWLGITSYVLATLVPSSIFRMVSGGAHCSTYLRCLVLSLAIMIGIGKMAAMMLMPQTLLFSLIVFIVSGGFYVIYKWVPADTPAKPIVSPVKIAMYRRLSYSYMLIWGIVVSVLTYWGEAGFVLAGIGGIGWQIFSITPVGYEFIASIERMVDKCGIDL